MCVVAIELKLCFIHVLTLMYVMYMDVAICDNCHYVHMITCMVTLYLLQQSLITMEIASFTYTVTLLHWYTVIMNHNPNLQP